VKTIGSGDLALRICSIVSSIAKREKLDEGSAFLLDRDNAKILIE